MVIALDPDRALEHATQDQLGFVDIAKQLAPSIIKASKNDGIVIGLEGAWGSGKTSLLNFLRTEINAIKGKEIHIITIAPWLNRDNLSIVESLLEPMIVKLEEEREKITETIEQESIIRERFDKLINLFLDYGPKTARGVALAANVAAPVTPYGQVISKIAQIFANKASQWKPADVTSTELKQKIIQNIKKLDIGFVIILDDLDRLEPKQAIEVVRMVRSVADFPQVTYLMCYDRKILAQALKTGLKVEDGDIFLQKIVQLTFNIPLPEPLDLRTQFYDEVKDIYAEVMNTDADGELLESLYLAVDQEGMRLSLPREVKLTLNNIRFIFRQVKDNVYFPDLCRLYLIRTTHFKLYQWLEKYLSLYSLLITKDAIISDDEKNQMGKELEKLLPLESSEIDSPISNFMQFIPGLYVDLKSDDEKESKILVFNIDSHDAVAAITRFKRLGSPYHYRFYFALTCPRFVMPDEKFNNLLELARENVNDLATRFTQEAEKQLRRGKTWFEHVLNRIDEECISNLDEDQLVGIVKALSKMMDDVIIPNDKSHAFPHLSDRPALDTLAYMVAKNCLKQLNALDSRKQDETVRQIAHEGESINWLIGYFFRNQLYQHERIDNKAENSDQWIISKEVLNDAINILKKRLNEDSIKSQICNLPKISSYLDGWLRITDDRKQVTDWVKEYCINDRNFLEFLNCHRTDKWVCSNSGVYYPLNKDFVEQFFDFDWECIESRLNNLKDGEFAKEVKEIQLAIKQSENSPFQA